MEIIKTGGHDINLYNDYIIHFTNTESIIERTNWNGKTKWGKTIPPTSQLSSMKELWVASYSWNKLKEVEKHLQDDFSKKSIYLVCVVSMELGHISNVPTALNTAVFV